MKFSERIRLARRNAGFSQAELARKVLVNRSAVSHWESLKGVQPSLGRLQAIAVATQVNFEWLATGRGEMRVGKAVLLDTVATAACTLVDEPLELRLVQAFREAPARARLSLVELAEELSRQRTGRRRVAA
ncbi:helix-turn-helix domain-containing protein [Luteimonas vadosa]|uniref:Helix-turn-helix transcriptional regulator n=1 Tax=Luteimonas vadosa TaxID=1165507 RepID=A0ABP9DVD0_9GAMM